MRKVIMIGCDLHDKTMALQIAEGREKAERRSFKNTAAGRKSMIAELKRRARAAGGANVVLAYEASGLGFGLYDQLTDAGVECHVVAPTKVARSPQERQRKTDDQDAKKLLDLVRAYVLAGVDLPSVWIPDPQTRDDRELVRMRLTVAERIASLKTQVRTLLKRNGVRRPQGLGRGWSRRVLCWLDELAGIRHQWSGLSETLAPGARTALATLMYELAFQQDQAARLTEQVMALAHSERYAARAKELRQLVGVAELTAMVFLTEMGDLSRFSNRRQVAAYLGLAPSSHESGSANDRKGHITRQGSYRIRKVLCQAVWSRVQHDRHEEEAYKRIVARNPKKKKVAVVACMRRLAIQMWHRASEAHEVQRSPGFRELNSDPDVGVAKQKRKRVPQTATTGCRP